MPCRSDSTQRGSQPLPLPSPSLSQPVTHWKDDIFEQGNSNIYQASFTDLSQKYQPLSFPRFSLRKKKSTVVIATHFGCCIAASKDIERTPKNQWIYFPSKEVSGNFRKVRSLLKVKQVTAQSEPGFLLAPLRKALSCFSSCCVDCSIQNWAQDLVVLSSTLWLNCVPSLKPCFWRQVLASVW